MHIQNIEYWNSYQKKYESVWTSYPFRKELNGKEIAFIKKYIKHNQKFIDIGCGTGRIIAEIIQADPKFEEITGIDFSDDMVKSCKKRFKKFKRIKFIQQDIQEQNFSLPSKATFATCIRVLKYLKNPETVIGHVRRNLRNGAIIIFTVTNRFSVSYFDSLSINKMSHNEVCTVLKNIGFELIEVEGFQKLPEFLYILLSKLSFINIWKVENVLRKFFGPIFFSRTLYYVAQAI